METIIVRVEGCVAVVHRFPHAASRKESLDTVVEPDTHTRTHARTHAHAHTHTHTHTMKQAVINMSGNNNTFLSGCHVCLSEAAGP